MRDAAATARAVAAFGLPGTPMEPPGPIEPEDWPVTLAQLEHEKLTGIAVAAVEHGWLPLKADQNETLVDRHREAMAWCLNLERLLLDVADAFEAGGIEFVVLKGPAVARVAYADPSWRVFHDLDLLVRTEDWRRAVSVLERDFGPRRIPEPSKRYDERFSKGAVFVTSQQLQLDLHRTLVDGRAGSSTRFEDVVKKRSVIRLADGVFWGLDPLGAFVHACIHAVLGDRRPRLQALRDVAQLGTAGDFSVQGALERAEASHTRDVVIVGMLLTSAALGWGSEDRDGPPGGSHRDADREAAALRRSNASQLARLLAAPGVPAKVAFIRSCVLPRREFLRARLDARRPTYLGRWAAASQRLLGREP